MKIKIDSEIEIGSDIIEYVLPEIVDYNHDTNIDIKIQFLDERFMFFDKTDKVISINITKWLNLDNRQPEYQLKITLFDD